jgi:hypothetical protein
MITKKQSDNPALSLFVADPTIADFLRNTGQHLLMYRTELTTIAIPSLVLDGLSTLRAN